MTEPTTQALIEQLKIAAIEIKQAGHYGWGNTCTTAADAIEAQALALDVQAGSIEAVQAANQRLAAERDALSTARTQQAPKGLFIDLIAAQGPEFVAEMAAIKIEPAPSLTEIEDPVTVPRGLLGAACSAIARKDDAPKTLEQLRQYTFCKHSTTPPATQPAPSTAGERERFEVWIKTYDSSPDLSAYSDDEPDIYDDSGVQRCWSAWEARAALPDHSEQHLDMVAALPVGGLMDFNIRGKLTRLQCWHRLTEKEAKDMVAFFAAARAQPVLEPLTDDFLQTNDYYLLHRFIETTEDDESYDITKAEIKRLADLGVVQSHGFGKYSVTMFGYWVHERYWEQNPSLPLKTNTDRDAEAAHGITQGGKPG